MAQHAKVLSCREMHYCYYRHDLQRFNESRINTPSMLRNVTAMVLLLLDSLIETLRIGYPVYIYSTILV